MEQTPQAAKRTPEVEDAGSVAFLPVPNQGFIQQAKLPGMQVQSRNNSRHNTASQAPAFFQAKTLMPVNIKQIVDAWPDRQPNCIVIKNCITSSVKVIDQIRGKQVDEYKGSFRIQDCSGEINASIWFTCGRHELDRIPEGAYAAAVGRLRTDGSSPELQCYDCRPIVNFNDITHHHLSVIATHIDCVFKPKTVYERVAEMWAEELSTPAKMVPSTSCNPPAAEPSKSILSPKKEIMSQETQGLNIAEAELSVTERNQTDDAIIKFIREESPKAGPEGVHVVFLCGKLKIDRETARKHLECLEADGEVYTTIDDDHYAAT